MDTTKRCALHPDMLASYTVQWYKRNPDDGYKDVPKEAETVYTCTHCLPSAIGTAMLENGNGIAFVYGFAKESLAELKAKYGLSQ